MEAIIKWERSHRLILSYLLGGCLPVFACLGAFALVIYHESAMPMPPPQVISEQYNLCLQFEHSWGISPVWDMITYRCDVMIITEHGWYKPGTFLDAEITQECGRIEFLPPDSDGIMGILETPDQLCRTIAHTGAESRQITYKIDKNGKFIELSRK